MRKVIITIMFIVILASLFAFSLKKNPPMEEEKHEEMSLSTGQLAGILHGKFLSG